MLLALALLACCRRSPRPSTSAPSASAPSASVASALVEPLAPGQVVVLWGRPADAVPGSGEQTYFLAPDGSLLGSYPGVYVAQGRRLWRLTTSARSGPGDRCPGGSEPFPVRTLHRTALWPADGEGDEQELLPYPAPGGPRPAEQLHAPAGGLGPFVFVTSQTVEAPCGEVPPRHRASFFAWELRDRAVAVPLDELRAGAEAGLDQALALLNRDAPRGLPPGAPDAPVGPEAALVTLVTPSLSPSGLGWVAQYTAPASWSRSRGGWGSHTRSERLRLPSFPPRIAPHARLPEPALRFVREHPTLEVVGVSVGEVAVPAPATNPGK